MTFSLKAAIALCLLGLTLPTYEASAQKRKSSGKAKPAVSQQLQALPIQGLTEYNTDTIWMQAKGMAFELGIDLQLPACDNCPTLHAVRQWYMGHYAALSQQAEFSEVHLERFALDATPTQPTDSLPAEAPTKKKRKSRKERRAEAKRLAENTVTNKTPRHSLDITVERLFENGYIATYRMQILNYAPHAAGKESNHYLTINKHTGKPLQWNELYLTKQRSKFTSAIANALQRHYNASDWKTLTQHLLTPTLKASALPLPQSAPVIINNSLYAVYTPGEITPTASDAPTLIIDTQWLKGTLTPAANSYFK